MKAAVAILLMLLTLNPAMAFISPAEPEQCHFHTVRRHLPRQCDQGKCEKCNNKECARNNCGHHKARADRRS